MIRTLIIGAGRIAGLNEDDDYREKPCTHAGALGAHDAFDLAGICDVDTEAAGRFAQRFGLAHSFSDVESALAAVRPDLVTVAVPYQFHSSVVQTVAASANRPFMIFCEKPMAHDLAHAEAMVAACKNNNVRLYSNNRRLTAIYKQFKTTFEEDFKGEAITVNAWCSSGLHAIGIHMIELLRMAFGEITWVFATREEEYVESLPFSANYTPDDPRVCAQLGFESGLVGSFTNSALTRFTYFEVEVLCRGGRIRVADNGGRTELQRPILPGASTLSYKLETPKTHHPPQDNTLFANIADSLATAETDGPGHPLSCEHGLRSYRVLDAMIRSANTGTRITL